MRTTILWFRTDLRLQDNRALAEAIETGQAIIPVYIWAPQEEGSWAPGAASNWWLHHALEDLGAQLREIGLRLLVRDARESSSLEALTRLVEEADANAVLWNRRYEPAVIKRDQAIKAALRERGLRADSCNSSVLFEPPKIANKSKKPFQVFTPLWKHYQTLEIPKPVQSDLSHTQAPARWPSSERVAALALLPSIRWDTGFTSFWGTPARTEIVTRLQSFLPSGADRYPEDRDTPALDGTSRLSPYLHFGQIGPREVWWMLSGSEHYTTNFLTGLLRQLVWREFGHHLLYHFPDTPEQPLRQDFALFPWDHDAGLVQRWQRGETGYPIVDAAMRQLWQTGWMHNRTRMIVGSLLVKHLLQHWLEGARWFWDTLVDADLANNTLGWQWIGGCGADAAPYFRIFNPITQGERFDPEGTYVKRYLPELEKLPAKFIHRPWEMPELELAGLGVTLGKTYPAPVIDHAKGRQRALAAFEKLKASKAS